MSLENRTIQLVDWGGSWEDCRSPGEALFAKHGVSLSWREEKPPAGGLTREHLESGDLHLFKGDLCVQVAPHVHHKPASGHQLAYFDFVARLEQHSSWGYCLLREIFNRGFTHLRQARRLKGPVIFIGDSPQIPVLIETLFLQGFTHFNLLISQDSYQKLAQLPRKLIGLRMERLESRDLIQSSAEHTICFVMRRRYSDELLSDLSYFHFLSGNSVVLTMVEESNFPIAEVLALGNEVSGLTEILAPTERVFLEHLERLAKAHQLWRSD